MACMYKVRIAQKVEGGSDKRHETQRTAIKTEPKYRQRPRPEREGAIERYTSRQRQPQKHRTHRYRDRQGDREEKPQTKNKIRQTLHAWKETATETHTQSDKKERYKEADIEMENVEQCA